MTPPLLEIAGLRVGFRSIDGMTPAVRGIDLLMRGGRTGVVGESGSGKSTIARAILGILPDNAIVAADRLRFAGESLLGLSPGRWRALRGSGIALIPQDPRPALNPLLTIGRQIEEAFALATRDRGRALEERCLEALASVGIDDPRRVRGLYPHEVSGGMGQRAMIAMMLALEPRLLIADEPTSALDLPVGVQILDLLDRLVAERELGILFISHDLRLVAAFCDHVHVMKEGRFVHDCAAGELDRQSHGYTRELLEAVPRL